VRGFFAGMVRKRLKLKIGSKKADGKRVYHLARTDGGGPSSGQGGRMGLSARSVSAPKT
jgi:hypothetical protein